MISATETAATKNGEGIVIDAMIPIGETVGFAPGWLPLYVKANSDFMLSGVAGATPI